MSVEKFFPVDPAGVHDACGTEAPAKPCTRRLNWRTADGAAAVTWCTLPDGHAGQCSGPKPRVIETDDLGPGRTRRP